MLTTEAQELDSLEAFFGYLQRRRKAPATILRWRPELRRLCGVGG